MIEHKNTEPSNLNFSKLEERLRQVNDENQYSYFDFFREFGHQQGKNDATLLMATGGSKAAAYYFQLFFEQNGIVAEVIEPRDYQYKSNIHCFDRFIAISNSGKTNGIKEAFATFPGRKYLITSNEIKKLGNDEMFTKENQKFRSTVDCLSWGSSSYHDPEKSFISIVPTLAPMLMILDVVCAGGKELSTIQLRKINEKIKLLLEKSKNKINQLNYHFSNNDFIQIMSGYETKTSSTILESNLTESGASAVVIHDKGSYCHGRSNLLFQNPFNPLIYLQHQESPLDQTLIPLLKQFYPHILLFHSLDIQDNLFWKEFYLSLQMYYLSKKIAEDRNIDLTMPEYHPKVIQQSYSFKGGM